MTTVHIGHVAARYRMSGSDEPVRRLDRLLEQVLREELGGALVGAGVPAVGTLCVKELHTSVRLDLSRPDTELVARWALTIAESLGAALRDGRRDGVVHYASRRQALIDLLRGFGSGDERLCWAWQRMGLLPGEFDADGVVAALCAEPDACGPLLVEAARQGLLVGLVHSLSTAQWVTLAEVALQASGFRVPRQDEITSLSEQARPNGMVAAAATRRNVAFIAQRSMVLRVAAPLVAASAEPQRRWAIASLAALEVEPRRAPARRGAGGRGDARFDAASRGARGGRLIGSHPGIGGAEGIRSSRPDPEGRNIRHEDGRRGGGRRS